MSRRAALGLAVLVSLLGCEEDETPEPAAPDPPAEARPEPVPEHVVRSLLDDVRRAEGATAESRTFGTAKRSLIADGKRTITYHLWVEPRTTLAFECAAEDATLFEVRVTADGQDGRTLFSRAVDDEGWVPGRADLHAFRGNAVRLELITAGEGRAAWGEPRVVRAGEAAPIPKVDHANRPRNVVMIVIDTARRDVFAPFTETDVHAPAMQALASDATLFDNAYTAAPWTKPACASLLTGLYPSSHDAVRKDSVVPEEAAFLSEHLQAAGFETALISANGYVSEKFGFNRGWDHYENLIRAGRDYDAEAVYAAAAKWLEHRESLGRFFLYIQTVDPHVPYAVPKEDLARYHDGPIPKKIGSEFSGEESYAVRTGRLDLDEAELAYVRALYQAEVTYHDRHFGRFIELLDRKNLLDTTLVVVTNDHGEELMDHGKIGHGHSLYDELLRSPLLFRYPRLFPAKKVAAPVSLVDVAPTILAALDVSPLKEAEGVPLLATVAGRSLLYPPYAVAEFQKKRRAIRLGRYKLITGDRTALYDLHRDPEEQIDLAESHPIARALLERYLKEAEKTPSKRERISGRFGEGRRLKARGAKIDPQLDEQLKALGYFSSD